MTLVVLISVILGLKDVSALFYYPFAYLLSAIVQFFAFSLHARRFHDLGRSGWLSLLFIIPFVNILVLLVLIFSQGEEKENRYGNAQDVKNYDLLAIFHLNFSIKNKNIKNLKVGSSAK